MQETPAIGPAIAEDSASDNHRTLFAALAFALPDVPADYIERAVLAVCEELSLPMQPPAALPGDGFKVVTVVAGKGTWLHAGMNGELLARLEPGIEVRAGEDREGWRQVTVRGWCRGDGLAG